MKKIKGVWLFVALQTCGTSVQAVERKHHAYTMSETVQNVQKIKHVIQSLDELKNIKCQDEGFKKLDLYFQMCSSISITRNETNQLRDKMNADFNNMSTYENLLPFIQTYSSLLRSILSQAIQAKPPGKTHYAVIPQKSISSITESMLSEACQWLNEANTRFTEREDHEEFAGPMGLNMIKNSDFCRKMQPLILPHMSHTNSHTPFKELETTVKQLLKELEGIGKELHKKPDDELQPYSINRALDIVETVAQTKNAIAMQEMLCSLNQLKSENTSKKSELNYNFALLHFVVLCWSIPAMQTNADLLIQTIRCAQQSTNNHYSEDGADMQVINAQNIDSVFCNILSNGMQGIDMHIIDDMFRHMLSDAINQITVKPKIDFIPGQKGNDMIIQDLVKVYHWLNERDTQFRAIDNIGDFAKPMKSHNSDFCRKMRNLVLPHIAQYTNFHTQTNTLNSLCKQMDNKPDHQLQHRDVMEALKIITGVLTIVRTSSAIQQEESKSDQRIFHTLPHSSRRLPEADVKQSIVPWQTRGQKNPGMMPREFFKKR